MKKAILFVDDEKMVLNSIKKQVRNRLGSSYVYETAESAEEALEILDELSNDSVEVLIIISDWLMPTMKGDEFLAKAHLKFPKTIKIILSGQIDESAAERAKSDANLYALLQKPWTEDDLINTIKAGLQEIEK